MTTRQVRALLQQGHAVGAGRHRLRASVAKGAAVLLADQAGYQAGNGAQRLPGTGPARNRDARQQATGIGVSRRGEEFGGRCLLDDLAGIHHGHPVGDARYQAQVVGDEDNGRTEFPLQVAQQVQDLRLDGDVQRRGGFVGDDEVRLAEQRHGYDHPLAQSAAELVRILAQAFAGVADADLFQHGLGAGPGGLAVQLAVAAQHLGELVADAVGRIEGGHGLLEDHRQAIAAQVAHAPFTQRQQVVLAQRQPRRLAPGLARQEIHQRQGG